MKTQFSKILQFSFAVFILCEGIYVIAQRKDLIKTGNQTLIQDTIKRQLADLSLQELSQLKVSVASKTALTLNESPGIVSLITREDIIASGARDLIDVLRLVPGFEFGIDVRGVTSIGIRGNWAHEGKVLILWDGQVMNEQLFPSVQVGNHYPVNLIDRIEIIRGPGSTIYGGNAELGVIKIITNPASELNGAYANAAFGWMEKSYGRRNISLALGDKTDTYEVDFSVFTGSANRSDQIMTDYYPDNAFHSYNMANQSEIKPLLFNMGINYKGVKSRLIVDNYYLYDRTMYGKNLQSPVKIDFHSYIADLVYEYQLNKQIKLIPRINYTQNTPWRCLDSRYSLPIYLDKWAERLSANLNMDYNMSPDFNILSGIEFYKDIGHAGDSSYFFRDPKRKLLEYNNIAFHIQGLLTSEIANFTIGGRFERNSEVGNSFVPRIAITKVIEDFHFKILYSFAFRPPGIENLSRYSSTPIGPEKTTVFEFETGYDIFSFMSISANIFVISIKDPIVFFLDPILKQPAYHNGSKTGTSGIEAEYRLKTRNMYATLTYSYYRSIKNNFPDYTVISNSNLLLGFPAHKLTLNSTLNISQNLSINLSGTYLSKRYADNNTTKTQFSEGEKLLMNFFFTFRKTIIENLSIGLGIYDFLNSHYSFIQPYIGGSAPLPGPSREFLINISYSI